MFYALFLNYTHFDMEKGNDKKEVLEMRLYFILLSFSSFYALRHVIQDVFLL